MKALLLSAILILGTTAQLHSQDNFSADSVYSTEKEVVAARHLTMPGITSKILGEHWRALWVTPFRAGVLNMKKFSGGLKAVSEENVNIKRNLKLAANNGSLFTFSPLDKDTRRLLPSSLRNSGLAGSFKDQLSTSHPFAPVISASLFKSAGLLHTDVMIAVLPDDSNLGAFRNLFKNKLGLLELQPQSGKTPGPQFDGCEYVVSTLALYDSLESSCINKVDAASYLKLRLMDMMLGNWYRNHDQLLWCVSVENGKNIYKPLSTSMDLPFSLYDGLVPQLVGSNVTLVQSYGENYGNIKDLTFSGRHIDRRILPMMDRSEYDSLAGWLRENITDEIIDRALSLLPSEWRNYGYARLRKMIINRRNKIDEAASELRTLIDEVTDIYGTDCNEEFVITNGNGKLTIEIYPLDASGKRTGDKYLERTLTSSMTDEVRLYTNAGKDVVSVKGVPGAFPVQVRLIEGRGQKTISGDNNFLFQIEEDVRSIVNKYLRYEPVTEDRGNNWGYVPYANYNSDEGLILGGRVALTHYDYGVKPFSYKLALDAGYAFGTKGLYTSMAAQIYSFIKGIEFTPEFTLSQLEVTRFFGLGNETGYDKQKDEDGYYKVSQNLVRFRLGLTKRFSEVSSLSILGQIRVVKVMDQPGTFLFENPSTYGLGALSFAGLSASFELDTRNNKTYPQRGWFMRAFGNFTPAALKNEKSFGKASVDVRAYYSADTTMGIAFAFRGIAGNAWGEFPFYESFFIGGDNSLKGYTRERFAGNGLLLAQSEIRFPVAIVNVILPGIFGFSGFGGLGRVYLEGESSKRWHSAFGVSSWISFLNRLYNFELSVAKSYEGYKVAIGTAFFL